VAGVPQQMLEKAGREGRVVDEGWQMRKDSSRFYALSILTSARDAQGQLLGFVKVTRDITAQKRAEAEQIKLQSLLNTVVDPILVIDQHGIVETFNPAAERVFGYRADEVLQRNVSLLMTAPDREQHDQYLRRFLETRDPHVIGIGREIEARRKDGSVFPAELTVSEMSVDGRCMFTGIVRDISTRRAVEESIKRSEERLSLALEAGHIGVWDLDVASGSILATGDLFAMLDVPDGTESLFSTWARLNHPDDQALVQEQFEQVDARAAQRDGTGTSLANEKRRLALVVFLCPGVTARQRTPGADNTWRHRGYS
jgi:PAS domain S-box-containing protein